eukprot:726922_1
MACYSRWLCLLCNGLSLTNTYAYKRKHKNKHNTHAQSWGIGANDVANAFSTSVGAKAVSLKQAVIIAAIFEFVGAVGLGATVTSTIRKKITKFELYEDEPDVLMLGMFCSLCSAALWLFIATKYSFPVSTTHSIIGAIIGFSVASKGMNAVDWYEIGFIVLFWIIAPVMAAIGTMILFAPLRYFILRKPNSYRLTLRYWPVFVFIVCFIMCIFLIIKGLKRLDFDYEEQTALAIAITFGISAGLSILSYFIFIYSGAVSKYVENAVSKMLEDEEEEVPQQTPHTPSTTRSETDVEIDVIKVEPETNKNDIKLKKEVTPEAENKHLISGMHVDIHDDLEELERNIHLHSEKFDLKTEKSFAWLQVCTAALDIFAHGSNDVANAVAPFAAMVGLYSSGITSSSVAVPPWILVIGAAGMVIGLATYGYKIMKCLGVRMVYVTSTRGYCIELSSAIVIIICSVWGYPASTTHAQVGATIGVGLMEKFRSNSTLSWSQLINWKLLAQVLAGWIFTLIFTAVTCAAIFGFVAYSPSMHC